MLVGTPSPADAGLAVVGASGFIGRHLIHDLSAAGLPVSGFTRRRPAITDGVVAPELARARTVVLVAGSINPAIAERDPAAAQAELDDFAHLVDGLARGADARGAPQRVVLASSGGTLYDSARLPPYREVDPVAPTTAYGRVKLAMEGELAKHAGWLEPLVLRLANVYGPGQRLGTGQGVVGHWIQAAAQGRPLELFGDHGTTRDYVYVADVTAAVLAAHRAADPPPVLNIGSGAPTTLGALAALVRDVVGRDEVEVLVRPARGFDRTDVYLDVAVARAALGWRPRTPLRAGLERTWRASRTTRVEQTPPRSSASSP